eukprot:1156467-Pelagomonas_calceolata.AAC.3
MQYLPTKRFKGLVLLSTAPLPSTGARIELQQQLSALLPACHWSTGVGRVLMADIRTKEGRGREKASCFWGGTSRILALAIKVRLFS